MIAKWFSNLFSKGEEAPEELIGTIEALELISWAREQLPQNQRGWLFMLGLYVQGREAMGMSRIQAGGHISKPSIDLWRENYGEPYKVRKYNPGDWERLVEPTFVLAMWLKEHGGMPNEHANDLENAVAQFKQTGEFSLPDCPHEQSFGDLKERFM